MAFYKGRLLQVDNPANPTGPNMIVNIDYPNNPGTLTPAEINQTSLALGQNISGNSQLYYPNTSTTTVNTSTNGSTTIINNQTSASSNNRTNISSNASSQPVNTTTPTPTANLTNNTNSAQIVRNTSATYVNYPIEELRTTADFEEASPLVKASIAGYVNENQVLQVLVQDQGNNITNFRVTVRTPAGVTQIEVAVYPDGSIFLTPKQSLKITKSAADQNSTKFSTANAIIRANYPQLVGGSNVTVVSATQEPIPALNTSVLVIRYQNNSNSGQYEFIV